MTNTKLADIFVDAAVRRHPAQPAEHIVQLQSPEMPADTCLSLSPTDARALAGMLMARADQADQAAGRARPPAGALTVGAVLAGPGGAILRRLGLPSDQLAGCDTWVALRSAAVSHNDRTDGGFWDAAERLDGVLCSGERAVLHALMHACDFTRLADKLGAGESWAVLGSTGGAHAGAVAACILRRDA